MRFELFIALRYLLAKRKQTFISVISLISVMGVAMGVASLIVVIGVMNGFSTDLRDKILGVNAHVLVMSLKGAMPDYADLAQRARRVEGVASATPFIYSEVMLSGQNGFKGVVLRGIDPATADGVVSLSRDMVQGSLGALDTGGSLPGIILGKDLADRLSLHLGSRVNLLSPATQRSAAGFVPKVKVLEVVGVFSTGMYEYDSSMAYVTLDSAAELLGFRQVRATGLELRVTDVYRADRVAADVERTLGGYPIYTRNWMEMNQNLFAALKLEKTAMSIILGMIVLVAAFSIITTLIMLVMEKTRDIAVLMSMGARTECIRRIFMLQGLVIGFVGTVLGYGLGLSASLLLKKYKFIKLPEGVYPLNHLPVRVEWLDVALIGVCAMAICFLATIYPARQAARLEPAEALRYE